MRRGVSGRPQLVAGLTVFLLVIGILTKASVTSSREPSAASLAVAEQTDGTDATSSDVDSTDDAVSSDITDPTSSSSDSSTTDSTLEFPESDSVPVVSDDVSDDSVVANNLPANADN